MSLAATLCEERSKRLSSVTAVKAAIDTKSHKEMDRLGEALESFDARKGGHSVMFRSACREKEDLANSSRTIYKSVQNSAMYIGITTGFFVIIFGDFGNVGANKCVEGYFTPK